MPPTILSNFTPPSSQSLSSSSYEEAPTPTISNRASSKQIPPMLNLGGSSSNGTGGNMVHSLSVPRQKVAEGSKTNQTSPAQGRPESFTASPSSSSSSSSSSLSLPYPQELQHSSSNHSVSSQEARFSSPNAEPIEMKRPLLEDTPVSLSPRMRSDRRNSPLAAARFSLSPQSKANPPRTELPIQRKPSRDNSSSTACSISSTVAPSSLTFVNTSNGEGAFWVAIFLQIVPYSLACDIIKTGVPWTLLRNVVLTFLQRISSGPMNTSPLIPTSNLQPRISSPLGLTADTSRVTASATTFSSVASSSLSAASPFSNSPASRQGVIQGIPNFGQTCFMNSVIQSLASLEPFLAYLERIHQVQQDVQTIGMEDLFATTPTTTMAGNDSSSYFASQVLELLMAANGFELLGEGGRGHGARQSSSSPSPSPSSFVTRAKRGNHNRLRIDPRPLLRRIGESHAQFQPKHMGEQQDAQEWLQALLGVVISDAHLDSITAASDHMRFDNPGEYYTESGNGVMAAGGDGPFTAVLAGVEKLEQAVTSSGGIRVDADFSGGHEDELDAALSLSVLLERIDQDQRSKQQRLGRQNQSDGDFGSTTCGSSSMVDSPKSQSDKQTFPEEKKQEDFEITVQFVASEQCLEALAKSQTTATPPPPSCVIQVPKHQPPLSASAMSDTTWGDEISSSSGMTATTSQSTAMKIVKSTISSITPSPLSGWLGSTIQCCDCQHVRPIRNSPFLDIPLVPTSVSSFLGGMHKQQAPNMPPLPACTIEQCLAEFTSVERVQDVECCNCTIQGEMRELQEEEMLLSGAIESTEKRIQAKGGDPKKETNSLREELYQIQLRLLKLRTMDPDQEEDLNRLDFPASRDEDSFLFDSGSSSFGTSSKLKRCDARKCLFLTRCPSILCCHIQRRYYDPYTNWMEKCVQHVLFDEVLNLAPYCAYSQEASTSWVAGSARSADLSKQSKERRPLLYRLQSIIEHRGNAHGGHYVSYRRFGSSWYRISDCTVTQIPWKQVRNCQAYMLFYEAM